MSMHIKKGDTVVVNTGADKGKKGKVLAAMPKDNKVLVEGVHIVSKSVKARKAGEESGIIKKEAPINVTNVNLVCPKCGKAARVAHTINKNGEKVRICNKCGAEIK